MDERDEVMMTHWVCPRCRQTVGKAGGPNQDWKAVGEVIELLRKDGYAVGIGSMAGGTWWASCNPPGNSEAGVQAVGDRDEGLSLAETVERLIGKLYEAGCPPLWIERQLGG